MNMEKQQAMEQCICGFIDEVRSQNPDTMCGLIQPTFVSCDSDAVTLTRYTDNRQLNELIFCQRHRTHPLKQYIQSFYTITAKITSLL